MTLSCGTLSRRARQSGGRIPSIATAPRSQPPAPPTEARETRLLCAVVGELHLDTQVLLPEHLDHRLEVVPVLAEHADLVLLDLRLDLELRVLDEAHDLLRLLHRDPLLDVDPLAHGAAG